MKKFSCLGTTFKATRAGMRSMGAFLTCFVVLIFILVLRCVSADFYLNIKNIWIHNSVEKLNKKRATLERKMCVRHRLNNRVLSRRGLFGADA